MKRTLSRLMLVGALGLGSTLTTIALAHPAFAMAMSCADAPSDSKYAGSTLCHVIHDDGSVELFLAPNP